MLVFDDTSFTIDGVTVFSDHANPDLFWYLPPTAPQIGTRGPDDLPNFALNTFRPAAADDATRGGGFLTIETVLPLERQTRQRIMARLNTLAEGRPSLSPVPMDTGTVRIVAVDLEGSGGTTNTNAGDLKFVERIFGATKPSMAGDQNAVFNLQLTQEGAVFLKKVFEAGSSNVGVVYDFEYTGLRPALDVEITTNFKRVYDHFSMHLGLDVGGTIKGVKLTLTADIDRVFDKLVQDGVIQVKVINFSSAADAAEKEKWAFDFFKDKLLTEWFTPTFSAVTAAGGDNSQSGGTTAPATPATTPASTPSSPSTTPTTQPASSNPSSTTTTQPASTPASSAPSTGTATPVPANPVMPSPGGGVERPPSEVIVVESATLAHSEAFEVIENFEPAQLTKSIRGGAAGRDVTLTSLLDSAQATLQFTGPGRPATVTVGGQELALDGAGRVSFDAPAGRTIQFTARYPATAAATDTFRLMFDHDKPPVAGFTVTPPSALYTAYLNGSSTTRDSAFLTTRGSGPEQSAAALRAWVAQSTSPVAIHAHASFEGDTSLGDWNQRLTERRLAVAQGIVGSAVPITTATAHGFDEARSANRLRSPADRVAILTRSGDAGPETVIEGTVTRPAATPGETPSQPNPGRPANPGGDSPTTPGGDTPTTPGGDTPASPGGDTPATPGGDTPASPGGDTPASPGTDDDDDDKKTPLISGPFHATLTFKLKSVTQIEDKSLTLRYNRQEAIKRTHAPQGPLFLMAQGLQGPPFFVDVDLNSTFFRKLDITIDNPVDYDAIGLTATDVELEYGDLAHPEEVLRHDVRFRHDGEKTTGHKFFLNEDLDLTYRVRNEFHFDAASGWEGSALSYELPTVETADRTLLVNPHAQLDFMTVTVMPGEIDAELMRHTTVRLSYQGTGWSREKVLLVEHDTPPTDWKLRLNPGDPRRYTYRLTHHLRDGTTRDVGPVETDLTTLLVDDPFENPLTVEFLPNYDPATAQTVFVQVTYSDPANDYERLFDLTFDSASLARQRLRIARINTDLGTFTYQITAMAADHSVTRFAPITTEDRFVFLGETLN